MPQTSNERIINHGVGYVAVVQPTPFKSKEMKAEKLTWLMFVALVAVAFGAVALTAPQLNNQFLAGLMSAVFISIFIFTFKD